MTTFLGNPWFWVSVVVVSVAVHFIMGLLPSLGGGGS